MGLFEPGWKNKDKAKALKWISKHRGSDMIDAIISSEDKDIKKAATDQFIKQINSPDRSLITSCMYKIFEKADDDTKSALLNETSDQVLLGRLAKYERSSKIRREIVGKIRDQGILRDLASHGLESAAELITDQDIIFEMLTDSSFIKDIELLSEWTKNRNRLRPIGQVFAEMVADRLEDPDKLLEALKKTPYDHIAFICALKIQRNKIADLKDIVSDNSYSDLARIGAVSAIHDENDLSYLADNEDLPHRVRSTAAEQIKTPEIRKRYCDRFGTHDWKKIDSIHHDAGDRDYVDHIYECIYCGKKKTEEETYVY